jgi:hypothetical protein
VLNSVRAADVMCRYFQVERGAEAALVVKLDVQKLSKLGTSSSWWQQPVPAASTAAAGTGSSSDAALMQTPAPSAAAAAAAAAARAALSGLQPLDVQQQGFRPKLTVVSANKLMEFVAGDCSTWE